MKNPAMNEHNEFGRVSAWVIGYYPLNTLCEYRIVRACQVGKAVEWEYCDGDGGEADLYAIEAPDSWRPLET